MDFILRVKGIKYIPMPVRKPIFIKKEKELIDAHNGFNNFYSEVPHTIELEALGYNVPDDALEVYAKAIIFSFTENSSGYSHGASSNNQR